MNKKEQVVMALELAYEKHNGQVDKSGKPYILHPITVAFNDVVGTYTQKTVAILHDIVEDTKVTFDDLREMGFDSDVISALMLLTKDEKVDYFNYIRNIRLSGNKDAFWVKIADLKHNMDISRILEPTNKDLARIEKYKKAMGILMSDIR